MYESIIALLKENRLKEALTQLMAYAEPLHQWSLSNEIENTRTAYELMLHYTAQGIKDPNKKAMHEQMIRRTYEMADRLHQIVESEHTSSTFYDLIRTQRLTTFPSLSELQTRLENGEDATDQLFDKLWTSPHWSEHDSNEACKLLNTEKVPLNARVVMISAVTLSLLRMFDVRKFLFLLLDGYPHPDSRISQRALVGIALTCYYHDNRIQHYPEALLYLEEMSVSAQFATDLYHMQIQLLNSARETQKINRKMREEILPEMMKNPKLNKDPFSMEQEGYEDQNPEWDAWIDKTGIGNKIRELNELHLEGGDIYMSTFSQLKFYPFFHRIPHWFYLFDPKQNDIVSFMKTGSTVEKSLIDIVSYSNVFCNSDKYSFCFIMLQTPPEQRKFIQTQFGMKNNLTEEAKELIQKANEQNFPPELICRQYILDLYRFFKLWMRRNEMHDIFTDKLDLWNTRTLGPTLLAPAHINQLADFLMNHGYLQEAIDLYLKSIERHPDHAQLCQKIGYIYQQLKQIDHAITFYERADLIVPDNAWNLRHLGQCYMMKGETKAALDTYEKLERMEPDNPHIAFQIGYCWMKRNNYQKALPYFHKAEYLSTKKQNAQRGIGWCLLVTGKHQEARKYYDLLTAELTPILEDWMNAGHIYQLTGDMPTAISHYRKAATLCKSHEDFIRCYQMDQEELLRQGADPTDLLLLPDEIL